MLIEQALYTLPEIMALRISSRFYESSVSSAFAMSLSMQLASRGIQNPHLKIQQEAIYGRAEALGRNLRADMLVELPQIGSNTAAEHAFGFRRRNYVEVKFFRSPGRSSNAPGTEYAGALVAELVRLMTLPVEIQSNIRDVGRYLLHVYQGKPSDYLAFRRQDGTNREWVQALLRPGPARVSVALAREPDTLVRVVGEDLGDLRLELDVTNTVIRPMYAALADRISDSVYRASTRESSGWTGMPARYRIRAPWDERTSKPSIRCEKWSSGTCISARRSPSSAVEAAPARQEPEAGR